MADSTAIPPFRKSHELVPDESDGTSIPGAPLLQKPQFYEVDEFLAAELDATLLNKLGSYLDFVATRSGTHIDSLSSHITKGRKIKITEDPGLHLIWYYDILFLKPIPPCLLNHGFWSKYLSPRQPPPNDELSDSCRSALGFLRTYRYLIKHESDFTTAVEKHLIPKDVKFKSFQLFIDNFQPLADSEVAPRYHYGQMRLSRLNVAVWLFVPGQWYYHRLDWQMGQYFARWAPPLLFIWASTNLVLSSFSLVRSSRGKDTWPSLMTTSWIFALVVLFAIGLTVATLLIVIVWVYGKQLAFAIQTAWKHHRDVKNREAAANDTAKEEG
ncbi:hypothetical protein BDV39DRAFT_171230 [Aspergillus sergii]|uniref:Uncharacterized protein n=1 Tax=Aspergillus sergii TaxID=1034303 RepID=A0A5N6X927_9EURO|nr:hypothetical protein BDV39DRAFT_171230 [Aspergillus sergii]